MRRLAICVLAVLPVFAAAPGVDQVLKAVEDRYNRSQTLQVLFNETYTAQGRAPKSESGTLYLRKPGRMRWDYSSPAGKLFVSDGKYLYLFTPGDNHVVRMKSKESDDMRAPLAFLLGRLHFRKDFQKFESHPEGNETWIAAEPKSPNLPYSKVEFAVTPQSQIRRLRVTGVDNSVLEFLFDGEKVNPPLDAGLFQFQLPPGATIEEGGQ